MNDREQSQEDELKRLFLALNSPLSDRDFVRDVMRRTKRYTRLRRLTLGIAAIIGIAMSAAPIVQLLNVLAEWLLVSGTQLTEPARLIEFPILAVVILLSAAFPSVLRRMSR